ncbi:hypothetical protein U1Q18_009346 [Sarracenia purpurea var. burkii]
MGGKKKGPQVRTPSGPPSQHRHASLSPATPPPQTHPAIAPPLVQTASSPIDTQDADAHPEWVNRIQNQSHVDRKDATRHQNRDDIGSEEVLNPRNQWRNRASSTSSTQTSIALSKPSTSGSLASYGVRARPPKNSGKPWKGSVRALRERTTACLIR